MATLTATAAQLTSLLKTDQKLHKAGTEAAINLAFIALTTLSHCLGVKVSALPPACSRVETNKTIALWKD